MGGGRGSGGGLVDSGGSFQTADLNHNYVHNTQKTCCFSISVLYFNLQMRLLTNLFNTTNHRKRCYITTELLKGEPLANSVQKIWPGNKIDQQSCSNQDVALDTLQSYPSLPYIEILLLLGS